MSLLPREPGKGSASVWPSCSSWPWPGAHGDELTLFKTWFLTWIWSLWVVLASLRKVTNSSLLYSKQKITFPSVLPALSPFHHCPLPHAEDGDQPLATRLPRRVCMWCSLPSCHVLHSCSPVSHRLRDREACSGCMEPTGCDHDPGPPCAKDISALGSQCRGQMFCWQVQCPVPASTGSCHKLEERACQVLCQGCGNRAVSLRGCPVP